MSEPLLERLVADGALSRADADRLAARHAAGGEPLDALLLEARHVTASRLPELLARVTGLPAAPESAFTSPDPRARRVFPAKVAERHRIAPFALDGRDLSVVTAYPPDTGLLEELGVMLSLRLRAHVAPQARVRSLVEQLYGAVPPPRPPPPGSEPAPLPAAEAAPLPSPSEQAPPGWTLEQARAALAAAPGPDEAIRVALRAARDVFSFAAAFSVRRDSLAGQDALGRDPRAREACRRIAVDLASPGLFGAPLATRAPYLGPPPGDPVTGSVLSGLGRVEPHTVLVAPVWVGERAACVLYADNDDAPVTSRRLAELFLLVGALGDVLARMIRERKSREPRAAAEEAHAAPGAAAAPAAPDAVAAPEGVSAPPAPFLPPLAAPSEEAWSVTEPARIEPDPLPFAVDVDVGEYEVLPASEALATARADDVGALVEALAASAPGSDDRRALLDRLAAAGPEAAAALVERLPGPVESGAPDDELPVESRGPIHAGVVAAGRLAEKPLLAALDDPDPERRRAAVALLARIGTGEVLPALAARVQDEDDRVAAEAARALLASRRAPAFAPVVADLRRALGSGRPGRSARAARALGRLRDADSVPVLIQLLDGGGELSEAAGEALTAITLQRLGPDSMRWIAWWREWRAAPRASWLLQALEGPDPALRRRAADELRRAGDPPVAYDPDAPEAERVAAARAWAGWWREEGLAL